MKAMINQQYFSVEDGLISVINSTDNAKYDTRAKYYEKLVSSEFYNKFIWGTKPKDYTGFATLAYNSAHGKILDIGCGGLIQTHEIYSRNNHEMILLDNSIEMLKIGKSRLLEESVKFPGKITLLHADAFTLPFEVEQFNSVFSFGMLHMFDDKVGFINEGLRVLAKGGEFYFSCLTTDRKRGGRYLRFLHKRKEVGLPVTVADVLAMIPSTVTKVEHYIKGNMLFIYGTK
jgi:ubiquinone/menaquinone biosynthesis C-methylase UbiE